MRIIDVEKYDAIVRHARETNPFYARWIPKGGPVPVLTRQMVQEHNDELLNGNPVHGRTSGSTGVPVRISTSPERYKIEQEDLQRFVRWMGSSMPRLHIILPLPERPLRNIVSVQAPLGAQILALSDFASRHDAICLVSYPTNAVLLAQEILKQRMPLPSVQRVILMSEPVDDWQRSVIRRAMPQARVWTTYSSVELGAIAFQCPHNPGFHHIMSHKLGVEVLDEKLNPVPFGQVGQLVYTDYFNKNMPLIRYALGDLGALGKCPCNQIPFPAFSQVLGKVRGALLHPDGRRVPFVQFPLAFRDLPGMKQFQIVQEELRRFTVKVVASQNIDAGIQGAFLREFGYAPQLDIVYMAEIPRDKSGKFSFSICKV